MSADVSRCQQKNPPWWFAKKIHQKRYTLTCRASRERVDKRGVHSSELAHPAAAAVRVRRGSEPAAAGVGGGGRTGWLPCMACLLLRRRRRFGLSLQQSRRVPIASYYHKVNEIINSMSINNHVQVCMILVTATTNHAAGFCVTGGLFSVTAQGNCRVRGAPRAPAR